MLLDLLTASELATMTERDASINKKAFDELEQLGVDTTDRVLLNAIPKEVVSLVIDRNNRVVEVEHWNGNSP